MLQGAAQAAASRCQGREGGKGLQEWDGAAGALTLTDRYNLSPVLQTKKLGAVSFAANGDLFWLEGRPSEKGRQVLVRRCVPASRCLPNHSLTAWCVLWQ